MTFYSTHWNDPDRLAQLLASRPDLDQPPAGTLSDLDRRRTTEPWMSNQLNSFDSFDWSMINALLLHDKPPTIGELADYLGPPIFADDVDRSARRLNGLGAIAFVDGRLIVDPHLRRVIRLPGGLGRPLRELIDVCTVAALQRIAKRLDLTLPAGNKAVLVAAMAETLVETSTLITGIARLTSPAVGLLHRLCSGNPITYEPGWYEPTREPIRPAEELVAFGMLFRTPDSAWMVPREIAIYVRGGRPLGQIIVQQVEFEQPNDEERGALASTGALAAIGALADFDRLLESIERTPLQTLQSGGVGVGQIKKTAKELQLDPDRVAALLDMAGAAGLVDAERVPVTKGSGRRSQLKYDFVIVVRPSVAAWRTLSPARRWRHLVESWFYAHLSLGSSVVEREPGAKPDPSLWFSIDSTGRTIRRIFAAQLLIGSRITPELFDQWMEWHRVLVHRSGYGIQRFAERELFVLATLGIVVDGAAHDTARAVIASLLGTDCHPAAPLPAGVAVPTSDGLDATIEGWLETSDATMKVQGDMTIVLGGVPSASVGARLIQLADVVSAGVTTVYRLSEASLHRAFERGETTESVHAFFAEHATTTIPIAVTTLIDDAFRRFGRVRVGSALSVIVTIDDIAAIEIERSKSPKIKALGLTRVAPTVFISASADSAKTLLALREAGVSATAYASQRTAPVAGSDAAKTPTGSLTDRLYAPAFGRSGSAGSAGSTPSDSSLWPPPWIAYQFHRPPSGRPADRAAADIAASSASTAAATAAAMTTDEITRVLQQASAAHDLVELVHTSPLSKVSPLIGVVVSVSNGFVTLFDLHGDQHLVDIARIQSATLGFDEGFGDDLDDFALDFDDPDGGLFGPGGLFDL